MRYRRNRLATEALTSFSLRIGIAIIALVVLSLLMADGMPIQAVNSS